MSDDILKITGDECIGVRPESGLRICSRGIKESPGGTEGPGVMGPDWTDTKRVIPGELDALHKPTGDGVPECSSMRSRSGDKDIRGRAKFKSTHEEPFHSSDWTPDLILGNRGKGGQGRK